MNILIIGCGNVGTAIAAELDKRGHDVSIVAASESEFDSLPDSFGGFTMAGVPIDTDVLQRAGIKTCDALYAVTMNDDTNIMVAQMAKQLYKVPKIFSRIIDLRKGEIFEEEGVMTVCPTKLTVAAALEALDGSKDVELSFDGFDVSFNEMPIPDELVGLTPSEIRYEKGETLFGVIRGESGLIVYTGQPIVLAEGDKLIFARKD